MTTMFIHEGNDDKIATDTEALYEAVASQEEVYLEEREEELRVILESDSPPPPRTENPCRHRKRAAEELLTGDSDEPPLSEATVEEMLRITEYYPDAQGHDL
jgi:hypothetical protein